MKKIFTLITMLMVLVGASQAEVNPSSLRSAAENTGARGMMKAGRTAVNKAARKSIDIGNKKYYPEKEIYYEADGTLSSKYEFTYDAQGNELSESRYYWTDGAWVLLSECTYDEHGNYLSESNSNYKSKYDNEYDSDGNILSSLIYYWVNEAWVLYDKEEYTYDAKGNKTNYKAFYLEDGAWQGVYSYEYTYDASGNIVKEADYEMTDGVWQNYWTFEYTYDDNGNCKIDDWSKYGTYYNRNEYTYDSNGIVLKRSNYKWKDGVWEADWMEEYTYDEQGNRLNFLHTDWATPYDVYQKGEYTYDDNGNLSKMEYYLKTTGDWKLDYYVEYTYPGETSITNLTATSHAAPRKVLIDGKVCIQLPNGQVYDATGRKMK